MRLFWALEIPPGRRAALSSSCESLRRTFPDLRWVSEELLHITLKFLGEVEPHRLCAVTEAGLEASRGTRRLRLSLDELGTFPPAGNLRVLWCGLGGEVSRLAELARRLDCSMAALGFDPEGRPFRAHITLARTRRGGRSRRRGRAVRVQEIAELIGSLRGAELTEPFEALEILLMRSELLAGGPRYEVLERLPLGAGES